MPPGDTGSKLAEMIKRAIHDGKLTTTEHLQILALADQDGVLDPMEKKLLNQLQNMLDDRSVKKVPD